MNDERALFELTFVQEKTEWRHEQRDSPFLPRHENWFSTSLNFDLFFCKFTKKKICNAKWMRMSANWMGPAGDSTTHTVPFVSISARNFSSVIFVIRRVSAARAKCYEFNRFAPHFFLSDQKLKMKEHRTIWAFKIGFDAFNSKMILSQENRTIKWKRNVCKKWSWWIRI